MPRCVRHALLAAALLAPVLAPAQELVARQFPANALRGELRVVDPPVVKLDGNLTRLAPGARIRNTSNLLAMSGALVGTTYPVHYTIDIQGQLKDVWLLRADELRHFWPRSSAEAANYTFDPAAQTWIKK
ncbi:MAG: hypothetical protein AB9M53_07480 [Leptothrix sp. (in: b-proteobacteria)]